MRITDLASSTQVSAASTRSEGSRRTGESSTPALTSIVTTGPRGADHPDQVAETALARAASAAQAGRVVANANHDAAASVLGDRLDLALVP